MNEGFTVDTSVKKIEVPGTVKVVYLIDAGMAVVEKRVDVPETTGAKFESVIVAKIEEVVAMGDNKLMLTVTGDEGTSTLLYNGSYLVVGQ